MSQEINVISRNQLIRVNQAARTVALLNGNGPIGPVGPQGATGATGATGAQGPQGIPGSGTTKKLVTLQSLRDSASAAATNNGATAFTAVSDPNFRILCGLEDLNYVYMQGRFGGSVVAATKLRVQYNITNDMNISTSDAGWTTLIESAGSHTVSQSFMTAVGNIPAGAKHPNCLLRCGVYGGDGIADPTITLCILNFYS